MILGVIFIRSSLLAEDRAKFGQSGSEGKGGGPSSRKNEAAGKLKKLVKDK